MTQLFFLRSGYVLFCAFAGILAWWLNGLLFERFQVIDGVNLIYWPHGLRVVLTILFERYAAIGLTLGAYGIAGFIWPEEALMRWIAPAVGGCSAYAAMRLLLPENKSISSRLKGLSPSVLIAIGTVSALINAGGHTMLRIVSAVEGDHGQEFAAMLLGDLLGALALLYLLKLTIGRFERG
ncbi:MAG: hypothetical protein EBZ03_06010 [Betaproteobacteria bacterium]|nr:hypothetical protein [Pseudomonadota bacterium]NBO12159.1 hypothetical protein [Betaproteobacteria bacterium]NBO44008.1 hypothetical protein [Betaproteobacteria bacterium]NBP10820.1 hypothetical protein [Betaproteobacteria bacterium]NBP61467.1 hypothetical protein [Betaproteobacteria bacterium]